MSSYQPYYNHHHHHSSLSSPTPSSPLSTIDHFIQSPKTYWSSTLPNRKKPSNDDDIEKQLLELNNYQRRNSAESYDLNRQLQPQQHQLVLYTNPQKYYSIRIDRPKHQTIHILPENYQFCTYGKKFFIDPESNIKQKIFDICPATIHFGKCTDFDVFVENELNINNINNNNNDINDNDYDDTATIFYKVKRPSINNIDNKNSINETMNNLQSKSSINNQYQHNHHHHHHYDHHPSNSSNNNFDNYSLDEAIKLFTNEFNLNNNQQRHQHQQQSHDNDDELEDMIRNFVREDRHRQRQADIHNADKTNLKQSKLANKQSDDTDKLEKLALALVAESSPNDMNENSIVQNNVDQIVRPTTPTNGRRILLKKSQADLLRQQQQQPQVNGVINYDNNQRSLSPTPFLTSNRDGVVQSRLLRFSNNNNNNNQVNHHQQQSQPKRCESPLLLQQQNDNDNNNNVRQINQVFGISPKSSSLSRYKNLIESRSETSSPIQLNFATGIDLYNLHLDLENRQHDRDLSKRTSSSISGVNKNPESLSNKNLQNNNNNNNDQQFAMMMPNNSLSSASSSPKILDSSHIIVKNNHHNGGSSSIHDNIGTGNYSTNKDGAMNSAARINDSVNSKNIQTITSPTSPSLSSPSSSPTTKFKFLHHNSSPTTAATLPVDSLNTTDPLLDFVARNQELNSHNNYKSNINSTTPSSTSPYHSSLNTTTTITNKDHYHKDKIISNSDNKNDSLNKHINNTNNDNESSNKNHLLISNTIDTFIKENEKFFHSGGSVGDGGGGHRSLLSRSLSLIENSNNDELFDHFDEMKYLQQQQQQQQQQQNSTMSKSKHSTTTTKSSLTDDEKALLHETLKVGQLYHSSSSDSISDMNDDKNLQSSSSSSTSSSTTISSSQQQKRRIIFVSKPAPKPEPKPEPKYVNGKMVFGQVHVQPRQHHGLQKGSVAERVMLFEKCPEKTSVTRHKLTELQRNRISNPNKIGNWFKFTEPSPTVLPQNEITAIKVGKNLKINEEYSGNHQPDVLLQSTTPTATPAAAAAAATTTAQSTTTSLKSLTNNNNKDEPKLSTTPTISSIPIFRRLSRTNSIGTLPGQLPRFYYPLGRPYSSTEVENQIKRIVAIFDRFSSRTITPKEFGNILKLCGIPVYWKEPLFRSILNDVKNNPIVSEMNGGGGNSIMRRTNSLDHSSNNRINNGPMVNGTGNAAAGVQFITCDQFINYWKKLISICYDDASRFIKILTQGRRNYIIPEDFEPLIQDVIDTHPGLLFLKEAEEFHSRYVHTVIARIYYCVDKTWSGKITLPELKKSNLLRVIHLLEEEDDINQITEYFSYEHFYVIYCKFWELDQDHDLFISKNDLARHNDSAISSRMIDRIFSGAVTQTASRNSRNNQMSYTEFVWFLLADEDKRHPKAIEYWFRCMDLDGDGCLSYYELEYFYNEQVRRMEAAGIEALPFTDCLCQMIDLISPKDPSRIMLSDLKKCRLTPIFFDTFFNLEKYLDHEQRDPFASQRDEDGVSMSDWDRYAAEEYELLVAEESAQNHNNYYRAKSSVTKINEPLIDYANDDEDEDYDDQDDNEDNDAEYDDHYDDNNNHVNDEFNESDEDLSTTSNNDDDDDDDDDDDMDSNNSEKINDGRIHLCIEATIDRSNQNTYLRSDKSKIDTNNNECKIQDSISVDENIKNSDDKANSDPTNNEDFFNNLDKEFYDYIQNEFEQNQNNNNRSSFSNTNSNNHRPTMIVKPIKLVKLNPINDQQQQQELSSNHNKKHSKTIKNLNDAKNNNYDDDDEGFF